LSRSLILLALSLFTWGAGEGMFLFFQPLYLQELGADPVKIGGILGAVGLAMTLSFLPAGYLSDRFGRRPLIRAAWILGMISTGVMGFANSLPFFVVGMILYGATSFVVVPLNSYTTAARGKLSVSRTITLISSSFNLGFIIGPLLGGWLSARFGLQANFQVASIIFLFSCLLVFLVRPQPVEIVTSDEEFIGIGSLINTRFVSFLALAFFITLGLYLPQPLTQNFLQNERGLNLVQIGQLISARSSGVVVLNLVLGQINPRWGSLLAQGCVSLFALFILIGNSFPVYLVGYFMMGGHMTARLMIIAQAHTMMRASNMGRAYGLLETVTAMALIVGPTLAGYLYSIQPELIYTLSIILILLGIIANLALSPVRRKTLTTFEK
jgi:MFS family permease